MNVFGKVAPIAIALGLLPMAAHAGMAAAGDNGGSIERQRIWFSEARAALRKGGERAFANYLSRLQQSNYPLTPYLEIWQTQRRLESLDDDAVAAVLARYGEIPEARALRNDRIDLLAKRGNWQVLADQMALVSNKSEEQQLLELTALWNLGRKDETAQQVAALWLAGKAIAPQLQPALEYWRSSGHPNRSELWQRIAAQMQAGDEAAAMATGKQVSDEERGWLDWWNSMARAPRETLENWRFEATQSPARDLIAFGLRKLAKSDLDAAWGLLEEGQSQLGSNDLQQLRNDLAVRAGWNLHPEAESWLMAVSPAARSSLAWEWLVRTQLRKQEWQAAAATIAAMPEPLRQSATWIYWQGRCAELQGDDTSARAAYARIAGERGYYSFLAAERLGQQHAIEPVQPIIDSGSYASQLNEPGLRRARELMAIGESGRARLEWRRQLDGNAPLRSRAAAQLALEWQWYDQAVYAAKVAKAEENTAVRYPIAYHEIVRREAAGQSVAPALIMALIRQESIFNADATSSVGALGLMQLMPQTAKLVSKKHKLKLRSLDRLREPEVNIALGTRYFSELLESFDGNPAYAAAAYNAGPHRVRKWQPQEGARIDPEAWIESIPFSETRHYVQQVLSYAVIYDLRLHQRHGTLIDMMQRGPQPLEAVASNP